MIGRSRPPAEAVQPDERRGFDDFEMRLGDVMRGERATLGKSLLDVQRELKIRATYISAIENADATAFETPGFVAGYVRSYARYLGMDTEWAYRRFCSEGNFTVVHGMSAASSGGRAAAAEPHRRKAGTAAAGEPLANPDALFVRRGEALLSQVRPGAVGSTLVLLALIGGIGYAAWGVLEQVQQVTMAPVEQSPGVSSEVATLATAGTGIAAVTEVSAGGGMPSAEALDRLYRPDPLDVPQMQARDAAISTLDPGKLGAFAASGPPRPDAATPASRGHATDQPAPRTASANAAAQQPVPPVKVLADPEPEVVLFAVRPAWVRVRAADGTVLLEKILDSGESYTVPRTEEPPTLRAGNSGSVFFRVNGEVYGPSRPGAQVAKNVVMGADALTGRYQIADLSDNEQYQRMLAELDADDLTR